MRPKLSRRVPAASICAISGSTGGRWSLGCGPDRPRRGQRSEPPSCARGVRPGGGFRRGPSGYSCSSGSSRSGFTSRSRRESSAPILTSAATDSSDVPVTGDSPGLNSGSCGGALKSARGAKARRRSRQPRGRGACRRASASGTRSRHAARTPAASRRARGGRTPVGWIRRGRARTTRPRRCLGHRRRGRRRPAAQRGSRRVPTAAARRGSWGRGSTPRLPSPAR